MGEKRLSCECPCGNCQTGRHTTSCYIEPPVGENAPSSVTPQDESFAFLAEDEQPTPTPSEADIIAASRAIEEAEHGACERCGGSKRVIDEDFSDIPCPDYRASVARCSSSGDKR